MKRNTGAVLVLCLSIVGGGGSIAGAADNSIQLPQSNINRRTFFNKITDFFAGTGKSSDEKKRIIREREAIRRAERVHTNGRTRDVNSQKQIKQQQKVIMDKVNAVNRARYQKKKK